MLSLKKGNRKSNYTIELVSVCDKELNNKQIWIGSNPLNANKIFSECISNNYLNEFKKYIVEKAEVKILNSRLDFLLSNIKNEKCYVEVKNVPLVDYNPNLHDDNKKLLFGSTKNYKRAAIFPAGYKKSKLDCISSRAYKHLEDLIELKKQNIRVCLVFILQREDPLIFKPNYIGDIKYSNKLKEAYDYGVEIYAYKFKWTHLECNFMCKVPIIFES